MKSAGLISMLAVFAALSLLGCNTAPATQADRDALYADATAALSAFEAKDPGLRRFFEDAVGYATFPSVGKGGLGFGGAYGRGVLYERGVMVGHCDLTQATVGFQLGGQVYRELIFFQTPEALESFKRGEFELAAQASAVAAEAGAAATADFEAGVVIFTLPKGGLMYEASIGGQKFSYRDAGDYAN